MKKKVIFSHIFTLLVFFASMLAIIFVSLNAVNNKNNEAEIRQDLSFATDIYQLKRENNDIETSIDYTYQSLSKNNSNLRLTVVDYNGYVLFDNDDKSVENYLKRPEILDLGVIYYRKSTTLHIKMMYLASFEEKDQLFFRIALPFSTIYQTIYRVALYSSLGFLAILLIAIILDITFINHDLKPLKQESEKLAKIVSLDQKHYSNEIESISKSINETEKLIQSKVEDLTNEKEKLNYIINTMNQGIIIINSKEKILLINDFAKTIFDDENYTTLSRLTIIPEIHDLYTDALNKKEGSKSLQIKEKTYLVSAHPIENIWVDKKEVGVSLLFVDITEEKRLENAKKDFFANASHELKSPLTSILGYTQMIKEGFLTEKEDIDDALNKIQSEGKRMNDIIIGMLELSRLESEDKVKNSEFISLNEVVQEAIVQLETEAQKKKVQISIIGENFLVPISKEDLLAIVKNLIENAIRYNKENGKVDVIYRKDKKQFIIQDTGIGIKKEDQDRIFERFYRVDKARSRKLGGTGLGLSIVKHTCNNNSITIEVDSKLGEGSRFILTFPAIKL